MDGRLSLPNFSINLTQMSNEKMKIERGNFKKRIKKLLLFKPYQKQSLACICF